MYCKIMIQISEGLGLEEPYNIGWNKVEFFLRQKGHLIVSFVRFSRPFSTVLASYCFPPQAVILMVNFVKLEVFKECVAN